MRSKISVGGRPKKNDDRHLRNYVGKFDLSADDDFDAFILAALYRAIFGGEDSAKALKRSMIAEAKRCEKDHNSRIKLNATIRS